MKIFQQKIFLKTAILLLMFSFFYCFALSGGDLFASDTGVKKDDESRSALIANNHSMFDSLISIPLEKENFILEPRFLKNFLVSVFLKHPLQESSYLFSFYDISSRGINQDYLSIYLLYKDLRI
jgi:hypothetical protein